VLAGVAVLALYIHSGGCDSALAPIGSGRFDGLPRITRSYREFAAAVATGGAARCPEPSG
jgi:hypothetical protein